LYISFYTLLHRGNFYYPLRNYAGCFQSTSVLETYRRLSSCIKTPIKLSLLSRNYYIWRIISEERKGRREKRYRTFLTHLILSRIVNNTDLKIVSRRNRLVHSSSYIESLVNAGMNGILKCLDSHLRWIKSNYASAVILNGRRSGNVQINAFVSSGRGEMNHKVNDTIIEEG